MGKDTDLGTVSSRKLWRTLTVPGFFLLASLFMAFDGGKRTVQDWSFLCVCVLVIGVPLISRWNSSRPGLIVVYISQWGCLQQKNAATGMLSRVFFPALSFLVLLSLIVLAIVTPNELETHVKQVAILGTAMAICVYFILRALNMQEAPGISRTRIQLLKARGHRWNGAEERFFETISPGKVHFQVYSRDGKMRKEIVDAEVVCDEERRKQINELIEQWIDGVSKLPARTAMAKSGKW
jgi:hypothetical protein